MSLDEATGVRREVNPLLLEVSLSNVNRVSGSWNNFQRGKQAQETRYGTLVGLGLVLSTKVKIFNWYRSDIYLAILLYSSFL